MTPISIGTPRRLAYGAVAWHAHAFLFGYAAAIVAGFLLTALPNWTGRQPIHGGTLIALFRAFFDHSGSYPHELK